MNMLFLARPFGVTATVTISITALSCFLFESSFFLSEEHFGILVNVELLLTNCLETSLFRLWS